MGRGSPRCSSFVHRRFFYYGVCLGRCVRPRAFWMCKWGYCNRWGFAKTTIACFGPFLHCLATHKLMRQSDAVWWNIRVPCHMNANVFCFRLGFPGLHSLRSSLAWIGRRSMGISALGDPVWGWSDQQTSHGQIIRLVWIQNNTRAFRGIVTIINSESCGLQHALNADFWFHGIGHNQAIEAACATELLWILIYKSAAAQLIVSFGIGCCRLDRFCTAGVRPVRNETVCCCLWMRWWKRRDLVEPLVCWAKR